MVQTRLALLLTFAALCVGSLTRAEPHMQETIAAAPEATGIAFLHLKLSPDGAELIRFEVTGGRLKPAPQHAGERLLLAVQTTSGAPLWQGTIVDPRTQVFEQIDAQGLPTRKVIEQNAPEVMARVPFFEEGQVVRVTRVTPTSGPGVASEKLLGTFRLSR